MPRLHIVRPDSAPPRPLVTPRDRRRRSERPHRCVRCGATGFGLVPDRAGRFRCGPELPCTLDARAPIALPAAA